MPEASDVRFLSALRDELESIEAETFEIQDHAEVGADMALVATTSCTSTTSSCTSSSGTSCCG